MARSITIHDRINARAFLKELREDAKKDLTIIHRAMNYSATKTITKVLKRGWV